MYKRQRQGVDTITEGEVAFAHEMDGVIKLICYAERVGDTVHAGVVPMIVKSENLLSKIDGATNAVKVVGRYAGENVFIGQGAGSLETGSAIVSDIVFLARSEGAALVQQRPSGPSFRPLGELELPYNIVFETADIPGITGIVATCLLYTSPSPRD